MSKHSPIMMKYLTRMPHVRYFEAHDFTYMVTPSGRVFSLTGQYRYREMKQHDNGNGYMWVGLCGRNRVVWYVHRLVASLFIPLPCGATEVNHKNGIKHDNRLENLEWVNRSQNQFHANETYLGRRGVARRAKETTIKEMVGANRPRKEIAVAVGMHEASVTRKSVRMLGRKPINGKTLKSALYKHQANIKRLASEGLYIAEISRALGIHVQTIHEARRRDPSIIIKNGRTEWFKKNKRVRRPKID